MNQRALCMEHEVQKAAVVQWIKERIQSLNAGRFKTKSKGAKSNCTLIAEKCVKALSGLEELALVSTCNKNYEIRRSEQVELIPYQEFIETIDMLDSDNNVITPICLTQVHKRNSIKYIITTRSSIIEDIQNLPGSAESLGEDKTLAGLIYYYYQDVDAGHLANFFRDKTGNVFFIDVQSEETIATVPTKVLDYELKEEVFFYPLSPKSGYFIEQEPINLCIKEKILSTMLHKQEQQAANALPNNHQDLGSAYESSPGLFNSNYRHNANQNSYVCDYPGCDKAYSQSGGLTRHKRSHTGEKPYVCDHPGCDKAYSQSGNLTQHKRTHTGERPYVCDYQGCDKAYAQSGDLTRHKRAHSGEKPYICDHPGCGKAYSQSGGLTVHKRNHTGEKLYVCDHLGCDKAFSTSSQLTVHKRTHSGEKPYICDHPGCDKAYSQSGDLSKHKRTHTGEKSYVCDYSGCDEVFSVSSSLTRHKRTHNDVDSSSSISSKSKKRKI